MYKILIVLLSIVILLRNVQSDDNNSENECYTISMDMEEECSSYCFAVIKPFLQYSKTCQEIQNRFSQQELKIKEQEAIIQMKSHDDSKINELMESKNERIETLNAMIKSKDNEISALKLVIDTDTVESLKETIKSLKMEVISKKEEVSALKLKLDNMNSSLQVDFASPNKEMNEIKGKIETLKTEVESVSNDEELKNQNKLFQEYKPRLPTSCLPSVTSTSIQMIQVPGYVLCDNQQGSGWLVIEQRFDGSVSFHRNWTSYKKGFGTLNNEFFIGMETIHLLTQSRTYELYIQLQDVEGTTKFARYDHFLVASEEEDYELKSVGNYSGNAGDSLSGHKGLKFATDDRTHAPCTGPWWYRLNSCGRSSLNRNLFKIGRTKNRDRKVYWVDWNNSYLTGFKMMIRPKV